MTDYTPDYPDSVVVIVIPSEANHYGFVNAGVLNQIRFWCGHNKSGWFKASSEDLANLTGLTPSQVRHAVRSLIKAGALEKRANVGAHGYTKCEYKPRIKAGKIPTVSATVESDTPGTVESDTPSLVSDKQSVIPSPAPPEEGEQPELFGVADRGATRRSEKLRRSTGPDISPFVEPLWKRYPTKLNKDGKPDPKSKGSKPAAERAVRKALKAGHTSGELLTRVDHYNDARDAYEASWGKPAPLMNASTFFNGKHEMFDHPWDSDELQYWPAPKGRDWAKPKRRTVEEILAEGANY